MVKDEMTDVTGRVLQPPSILYGGRVRQGSGLGRARAPWVSGACVCTQLTPLPGWSRPRGAGPTAIQSGSRESRWEGGSVGECVSLALFEFFFLELSSFKR